MDPPDQIGVELVGVVGVVTADDVHLGQRLVRSLAHLVETAVEIPGPALLLVAIGPVETAELAVDGADVGRVEVHVANEVRGVAVLALAHDVGHRADGHQLLGFVQPYAVREGQPPVVHDLGVDVRRPADPGSASTTLGHVPWSLHRVATMPAPL